MNILSRIFSRSLSGELRTRSLSFLIVLMVLSGCLHAVVGQDGIYRFRQEGFLSETVDEDTVHPIIIPQPIPPRVPRSHSGEDSETLRPPELNYPPSAVIITGDTLFSIFNNLGPYTPAERAQKIVSQIELVIASSRYRDQPITVREETGESDIICGDLIITAITNEDARIEHRLRQEIAATRASTISQIVERERARRSPQAAVLGLLFTAIATVGVVLLFRTVTVLAHRFKDRMVGRHALMFGPLGAEPQSPADDRRADRFIVGVATIRILLQLALIYVYVTLITGFFYSTKALHISLYREFTGLFVWSASRFINYLPQLFILAAIATATYVILQLVRFSFVGVSRGALRWSGFRPEWAQPSYRIASLLIMFLALVIAWPHFPGSGLPAFTGIAIFAGALIVIGSAVFVANGVSGVILGFSVPFRVGDRVRIAGAAGEVISMSLIVTRLRSDKNAEVTIPNAVVLSSQIVNFSRNVSNQPMILPTQVTAGYEVPSRQISDLLIRAARQTADVLSDPAPYVNQLKQNPESAVYELNVHVSQPARTSEICSGLHRNIQKLFSDAGIRLFGLASDGDKFSNHEADSEIAAASPVTAGLSVLMPWKTTGKSATEDPPSGENVSE